MSSIKIQVTRNYGLFHTKNEVNRRIELPKHKALRESMERYGFLRCFPLVASRDEEGKLWIKDGQHRRAYAEKLGLPVYWVEEEIDFDIALVNSTSRNWGLPDYAHTHAAKGLKDYEEGLDFCESHSLSIGRAFALLAGTVSFSNCATAFKAGEFKIVDRPWAEAVASLYLKLVNLAPVMRGDRLIEACMALCRVKGFDAKRLLAGAERMRHKLLPLATKDAYLDLLQEAYNHGRTARHLVGLKTDAIAAMRERAVVKADVA